MSIYAGKKALVIGLGLSGRAAAKLLIAQGASVHGVDRDQNLLDQNEDIAHLKAKGMTAALDSNLTRLTFDLVVLSPGVPFSHPLLLSAKKEGIETIGEIELGCRLVKNPILGITGTNGKTTVTMLVTHVLNACGHAARALGNVGVPFSQELINLDSHTIIVLELSSYQLETLSQRVLDGGVILNITPDHLDRYEGMDAYAAAKLLIGNCLKPGAPLYLEEKTHKSYGRRLNLETVVGLSQKVQDFESESLVMGAEHSQKVKAAPIISDSGSKDCVFWPTPTAVSRLEQVKGKTYGYASTNEIYTDLFHVYHAGKKVFSLPESLKGKPSHDVENLMAAYALCSLKGVTGTQFINAFQSFHKPPHRIEFVLEKNGISYYDDSKGTNIDAVIRAVEFFNRPIVLIAGGVDKRAPYTPWLEVFRNKVKCICAIGQAAAKMELQLSHQIPVKITSSLKEAVREATLLAKEGDIVLLSPGCSSFDMFRDYAHRGEVFQEAVKEI